MSPLIKKLREQIALKERNLKEKKVKTPQQQSQSSDAVASAQAFLESLSQEVSQQESTPSSNSENTSAPTTSNPSVSQNPQTSSLKQQSQTSAPAAQAAPATKPSSFKRPATASAKLTAKPDAKSPLAVPKQPAVTDSQTGKAHGVIAPAEPPHATTGASQARAVPGVKRPEATRSDEQKMAETDKSSGPPPAKKVKVDKSILTTAQQMKQKLQKELATVVAAVEKTSQECA